MVPRGLQPSTVSLFREISGKIAGSSKKVDVREHEKISYDVGMHEHPGL